MVIDIAIGYTKDDKKKCFKDFVEIDKLEGVVLKEGTSLNEPIFIFNLQKDISEFADINYIHWFKMKRYYYVTDIVFTGRMVEFHCVLDVRKTWRNTIKNSSQFVSRQENKYNKQLFDAEIPIESKKRVGIYKFPVKVGDSTETSRNYILITNGKIKEDE